MRIFEIKFETLKKIPRSSGIYYFFNENNDVVYAGKASNLQSRILAHFYNYSLCKEIEYFVKMLKLKGYSLKEKEKIPNGIMKIWESFKDREFSASILVIDENLDKVKMIKIEEISKELTKSRERELILDLEPIFKKSIYFIFSIWGN